MTDQPALFNAYYYQHSCGSPYTRNEVWLTFFEKIAKRIVSDIRPASVLDAGCAMGFLVEGLRNEGVEAYGIDVSDYAIQNAYQDIKPYLQVGSILDPLPRKYDLVVSIEVLEHMANADAEKAIANLCQYSDDILFSSTPFDYREATHFNVQPPDYWVEQFARYQFYRDVDFDASFITPWAVRLRRRADPFHRIIRDYDRKHWPLIKENWDLRNLANEMTQQISTLDAQVRTLSLEKINTSSQQNEIAALKNQIAVHEAQWADLQKGVLWRILKRIWNVRLWLIPHGSRREAWLNKVKARFR